MKSYLKSVIKANEGNFLATLVKALLPVDIPEFSVPVGFCKSRFGEMDKKLYL